MLKMWVLHLWLLLCFLSAVFLRVYAIGSIVRGKAFFANGPIEETVQALLHLVNTNIGRLERHAFNEH